MVRRLLSFLLGVGLSTITAAAGESAKTTPAIKGMTCGGCVAAVKLQVKKTEGVTAYEVSLEKGEADVSYDPSRTDPETIAASVSESGFEAAVKAEKKTCGPTSDAAMQKLDLAQMREWFNRSSDSVRIVSLLSPT